MLRLVMFGCLSLVSLVIFFLSCCILSSPSMLSKGNSSFSVLVHLRGLELTADWFEYQIRESWIHSWSRLISLFKDVQSVRCMAISFTYHLRSYMH